MRQRAEQAAPSLPREELERASWKIATNQAIFIVDQEPSLALANFGRGLNSQAPRIDLDVDTVIKKVDSASMGRDIEAYGGAVRLDIRNFRSAQELAAFRRELFAKRSDLFTLDRHYIYTLSGNSPPAGSIIKSTGTLEILRTKDIDDRVGEIIFAGGSKQSLKEFFNDLYKEFTDARNPLNRYAPLKIKDAFADAIEGLDPRSQVAIEFEVNGRMVDGELMVARLRHEFGQKYLLRQIGPMRFEVRPFAEAFELSYAMGESGRLVRSTTLVDIHERFAGPDALPPGAVAIVIARRSSINVALLNKKNLYSKVEEIDLASLPKGSNFDPRTLGRGDSVAFWIQRKGSQVPLEVPQLEAVTGQPQKLYASIDSATKQLAKGYEWELGLRAREVYVEASKDLSSSSVSEVTRQSNVYVDKVFIDRLTYGHASEIAHAVHFGKLGIGPEVEYAATFGSRPMYVMRKADGNAASSAMSDAQVMSYARRNAALLEHGYLSLDDKAGNVLLQGQQAQMHDFSHMHRTVVAAGPYMAPRQEQFGTIAPPEVSLQGAAPTPEQTQAFLFANTVLSSRLGEDTYEAILEAPGVLSYNDALARVPAVDGPRFVEEMIKHKLTSGLRDEAFSTLIKMLDPDVKARPSVKSFIEKFEQEKLALPAR